jgi:hypothetical protein
VRGMAGRLGSLVCSWLGLCITLDGCGFVTPLSCFAYRRAGMLVQKYVGVDVACSNLVCGLVQWLSVEWLWVVWQRHLHHCDNLVQVCSAGGGCYLYMLLCFTIYTYCVRVPGSTLVYSLLLWFAKHCSLAAHFP